MSISLSNYDSSDKNFDLEKEIEQLRENVENFTRENEKLASDIKFKENDFKRRSNESELENQMSLKTIENLEELVKKLKEFQIFPENQKERVLEEIKLNFIQIENKLIISQNSENRIKLEYDLLINENKELKCELQNANFKNKSTTNNSVNNILICEEDEELDNVETLKDIILELSKEYDDLKLKYNNNLDNYYEKEKVIMEIKEKLRKKEDDYLKKTFEFEAEIRILSQKTEEYEDEMSKVFFFYKKN